MPLVDILGHEGVRTLLAEALRRGRLPSSLLFVGPDGIGKRTLAIEIGRALVCERPQPDACGRCSPCARVARAVEGLAEQTPRASGPGEATAFNRRLHPDILLIEPSTEAIRIEQVRAVVEEIAERPFEGRGRAIIFDDAHCLTEQAENTLLKSLEEPPSGTHFILVTPSPEALLPTIRSRCQRVRLGGLPPALIADRLVAKEGLDRADAALRARLSGGSLRRALDFESETYRELRAGLVALLEKAEGLDDALRMEAAERLADPEHAALSIEILRSLLRDVAALAAGADAAQALNADLAERLAVLARGPLAARARELAEACGRAARALEGRAHGQLTMDLLVDAISGLAGTNSERLRPDDGAW
jgi:DNA polymerase-3 subunit delta'